MLKKAERTLNKQLKYFEMLASICFVLFLKNVFLSFAVGTYFFKRCLKEKKLQLLCSLQRLARSVTLLTSAWRETRVRTAAPAVPGPARRSSVTVRRPGAAARVQTRGTRARPGPPSASRASAAPGMLTPRWDTSVTAASRGGGLCQVSHG